MTYLNYKWQQSRILGICCLHCTACITRNIFLVLTALCVGIIVTNGADAHRSLLLHFWSFLLIVILQGHFISHGIDRILHIHHYVRLTQHKCLTRKDTYIYTYVFYCDLMSDRVSTGHGSVLSVAAVCCLSDLPRHHSIH